jgi:hypothetical protein
LLFFSSIWSICFLSACVVVIDHDSVALWNLISFFVEVIATCFVSLSTLACNLLGFVARLLLPSLSIGCFIDLKIIVSEGLYHHSALLFTVVANFVAISFLAIWEMSLLSELLRCSSWGIVLSPPSSLPPILLIPFNKSCFVEPCVLNRRHVVV